MVIYMLHTLFVAMVMAHPWHLPSIPRHSLKLNGWSVLRYCPGKFCYIVLYFMFYYMCVYHLMTLDTRLHGRSQYWGSAQLLHKCVCCKEFVYKWFIMLTQYILIFEQFYGIWSNDVFYGRQFFSNASDKSVRIFWVTN